MYAIVEIGGQQFKVEENKEIFVNRLKQEAGESIILEDIYLLDDGKKVQVGTPILSDVKIKAKILEHLKADKVLVFKKKRRKGYQKLNGHRQFLTKILIEDIVVGDKKSKSNKKKEIKETSIKDKAKEKN